MKKQENFITTETETDQSFAGSGRTVERSSRFVSKGNRVKQLTATLRILQVKHSQYQKSQSDSQTVKQSNSQTVKQSNSQTVKQSNSQTVKRSYYQTDTQLYSPLAKQLISLSAQQPN